MQAFPALTARPLPRHATFCQPSIETGSAKLEDPATSVMTDLKVVTAVTIDPQASIEHAMRVMVRRNVRLLLVVNVENEVEGLITATDLLGEKPLLHLREFGGTRGDIAVADIMTPQERLEVLAYSDVRSARVGHIVTTLARSRRQHALAAEYDSAGHPMIRGIFSTSQIARQLGEALQTGEVAHSFAEIQAALNHD
ncbi:MAG TPA: CBS domain-containing protein [Usitatibacter sp.]|nr:CBS domain-containing protein [Usitatibacter sp.]